MLHLVLYDLRLPACHSLKEKRRIVKSLKQRLRNKFNVSVAETDHLELWQRTEIAIALVSRNSDGIDSIFSLIDALIDDYYELERIGCNRIRY